MVNNKKGRKVMFKRGDIVEYDGAVCIYEDDNLLRPIKDPSDSWSGFYREHIKPYTGPIYEKDGQRFVPSGEFRLPKKGEWFLGKERDKKDKPLRAHWDFIHQYKIILLPVPSLEPESEFKVGDWVRIIDGKESVMGVRYRPDMKLNIGEIHKIVGTVPGMGSFKLDSDTWLWRPEWLEKLPGRPLTTDDLMMVQSGEKVEIECHACKCGESGGVRGRLFPIVESAYGEKRIAFYHTEFGDIKSPWLARYEDGSIMFADGVEGNIFVIGEDNENG